MTTICDIMPEGIPAPTCFAGEELDKKREYEWFKDMDHLLNLTINQFDKKVIWAALIGNEDPRGSFLIEDGWPEYLTAIVKRIMI